MGVATQNGVQSAYMSGQPPLLIMRILFSADWHIKLGQKNVPKPWQMNRYKMLFKKLHELEELVDLHIIGGDIFDKKPSPEENELYYNYIKGVKVETIIFDGNHEATKKGKTFLTCYAEATNELNKNVTILDGIHDIYGIDFIPYTHLKTFNPADYSNDILCTHVRGSIPPHVMPEIDLGKLARWRTVLAGDLHAYENSQQNIIYPGSPLSISFHRNPVRNGVILMDTDSLETEWIDLELPQLIRKTVENEEDIIKTDYDHTIYEITGNIVELSGIDTSSDLIDKKIINKASESTLNLTNISKEEELRIYLKEIVKLSDEDIDKGIGVFNDHFSRISLG